MVFETENNYISKSDIELLNILKNIVNIMSENKTNSYSNHEIVAEIAPKDFEDMDNLIKKGVFVDSSDFLRQAVRDKLNEYEIIEIRDVDRINAREEIIDYCEQHENFDVAVIADDLNLDVFLVYDIVQELIDEKIIEEVLE